MSLVPTLLFRYARSLVMPLACTALLGLSGCGRKGPPLAPDAPAQPSPMAQPRNAPQINGQDPAKTQMRIGVPNRPLVLDYLL